MSFHSTKKQKQKQKQKINNLKENKTKTKKTKCTSKVNFLNQRYVFTFNKSLEGIAETAESNQHVKQNN